LILVIGQTVSATGFTPDRARGGRGVDRHHRAVLADLHLPRRRTVACRHRISPEPDHIARSALFAHLLMVAGIVATAVGSELVIDYPLGHTQPAWIAVTFGGPALFLAGRTILERQVSTRMSWDRLIGISVLAALTPAMLHVVPLLVALTATAVLTGNAIADAALARGRPPEPSPPPDRPS
jgi:Bacterial low temperature requirement A protein (LtrA)